MTNVKEQAKTAAETAKKGAENTGLAAPSTAEVQKARTEGVTEAIKENAKDAYQYLTDGQQPGETSGPKWLGSDDIQQFAGILGYGVDAFKEAIDAKATVPLAEEKVAGLLKLERAGQNRTEYVQALMKRLGVKSPYEVTNAGPDYTNDVTPVTKL